MSHFGSKSDQKKKTSRSKRIEHELKDIQNDKLSHIKVDMVDDDLTHLKGHFTGPPDTPYEGGKFTIDIKIPSDYPFRPPNMKFETKIWHPNVSSVTGAICLDTLSTAWSPVLNVKSALLSLQSLLSTPEPKDPQDAEVAGMLIRNPAEFEHVARDWAVKYAGAPRKERGQSSGGATAESLRKKKDEAKRKSEKEKHAAYHGYNKELIDSFVAMGFELPAVVSAFEYVGIDKNGGEWYELEPEYMGDITARLFGEP